MDDLREFKTELVGVIRQLLSEFKGLPDKQSLKSYEVKELLGISTGTLQNLRNNGILPFTKIGGTIYYDSEDIQKVLNDRKRDVSTHKQLVRKY